MADATTVDKAALEHGKLVHELSKLSDFVESSDDPPVEKIESVFQYLDDCRIPTTDKPTANDDRAVDLAISALLVISGSQRHLVRSRALDASLARVWTRIWKWLEFLDTECCQKFVFGSGFKIKAMAAITTTLFVFAHSAALKRLVTTTPGVFSLLVKHWLAEGLDPAVAHIFGTSGSSRPFARTFENLLSGDITPNCLPDVVAAAPGGATTVARIAIQHLDKDASAKHPDFTALYHHVSLIYNLFSVSCPALPHAFLNRGLIPTMVKMLASFNLQPVDTVKVASCVVRCYFILIDALQSANGPSWVIQAFDSGILSAILKSGRRLATLDPFHRDLCTTLLSDILCQYLVYRSVLGSVAKALRRMERLCIDQDVAGPLWDGWMSFKSLAQERIAIKEENDDGVTNRCNRIGVSQLGSRFSQIYVDGCPCSATTPMIQTRCCAARAVSLHSTAKEHVNDLTGHLTSPCVRSYNVLFEVNLFRRYSFLTTDFLANMDSEGTCIPLLDSDKDFVAIIAMKDVLAHAEKLLSYVKDHREPMPSISSLAMSLDYTAVPVTMTVLPTSELLGMDSSWDSLIQQAHKSGGESIFTKADIQRGGSEASVTNLICAPLHRELKRDQ